MSYRIIRQFRAETEGGKAYTIIERAKQIRSAPEVATGRSAVLDGSLDWITSTGLAVNSNDDGTFEIVQTDEIVREV